MDKETINKKTVNKKINKKINNITGKIRDFLNDPDDLQCKYLSISIDLSEKILMDVSDCDAVESLEVMLNLKKKIDDDESNYKEHAHTYDPNAKYGIEFKDVHGITDNAYHDGLDDTNLSEKSIGPYRTISSYFNGIDVTSLSGKILGTYRILVPTDDEENNITYGGTSHWKDSLGIVSAKENEISLIRVVDDRFTSYVNNISITKKE